MRSVPILFEHRAAEISLLIERLTEVGRVSSLIHDLRLGAGLSPVQVGRTGDFLTRSNDVSKAMVVRHVHRRKRCHGGTKTQMQVWRLHPFEARSAAVDDISLRKRVARPRLRLGDCRFPCSACPRPFLTCRVFFGETLLSSLAFPVVITNTSAADNDSTPELPKHRARRHNGNLA